MLQLSFAVDESVTNDGSPQMTKQRNSQGVGDHKSPRRPAQGPESHQAIQHSSKSMDFSGFHRAMLLAGAKLVARTSIQSEEKEKVVPPSKLGKPTHAKPQKYQESCTISLLRK